jgi:hypothetical protein
LVQHGRIICHVFYTVETALQHVSNLGHSPSPPFLLQTGVLVADVDSFVHINGCDISDNMRRGVTAQKSGSFVLENSTVLRNHNIGVIGIGPWEEQVEPLQIRNNRIADNLSTGLWLQRGNANIEGNTICGNGDSGLVAFGPTSIVTIKDGTICNNKGTGISVHSTQHISVTGCFIGATRRVLDEDSRTAVMMAMHPRLGRGSILRAIDDAVCSEVFSAWSFDEPMGNMGTGIELRGTSAIISGNKIAHSGDVGVMVGEKCCIELVSNTIEGNVCGVKIKGQGAKCLSRSNVCERSTEVGVEVSAGGCWLSPGGDKIRLSGGWGLSVEDGAASVHARDVLVDNNLGGGVIVAAGGTTVEMSECVISRNRGDAVLVQVSRRRNIRLYPLTSPKISSLCSSSREKPRENSLMTLSCLVLSCPVLSAPTPTLHPSTFV